MTFAHLLPGAAPTVTLGRFHARRLRDVYRSAGWPCLDTLEIELLAAGLLERITEATGHERMRVTAQGLVCLAHATEKNRRARSAHERLVERIGQTLLRDGRVVWTGLSLRARLPPAADARPDDATRWKVCMPDVFSIRNTTVAGYLEPIVHEIKVSRADLLSDLKRKDKRDSYLDVGGQCWYVLGCDAKGRPIGTDNDVPPECGVMLAEPDQLHVLRNAAPHCQRELPFSVWMALAKATPLRLADCGLGGDSAQALLAELEAAPPAVSSQAPPHNQGPPVCHCGLDP